MSMIIRFLILGGALLLASNVQAATAKADAELSLKLVELVYRPAHAEFAALSSSWAEESSNLCDRRLASSAYRMQSDFTKLIEVFSAIELHRLGPLLDNNLNNRLFYWPDKRGVGERQFRDLLDSAEIERLTATQLSEKSVAVQGFSLLERLLFDPSLQPLEESPQCHLITAVVDNIANMALQLDEAWQSDSEFVQSLLQPHPDSKHFRSSDEVLRTVFTQAKVGLDIVLKSKLSLLLSDDENKVAQAPFWQSQRTVAMLAGNLRGLQRLLLDSGFLVNTRFQEELRTDFDYIEHVLRKLKPIVRLTELHGGMAWESRVLLNQFATVVARIRYVVITEIAHEFAIRASFNSEDGD